MRAWLVLLVVFASACGRADLPADRGDYPIHNNEIRFDGQHYVFRWVGKDNSLHLVRTDRTKLVEDERTYLQMDAEPILHLAQSQPIQVEARDHRGSYGTAWYPFFWGPIGGGPVIVLPPQTGGSSGTASYRYPPTDTFGRGDTLGGSVPSSQPKPPDYTRLPNAANTVAGQEGGTGGGAAATGRSAGAVSGQSGGTGAGSAASGKGGFRTGPNAFSETRSAPPSSIGGKPRSDASGRARVGAGGAGSAGALGSPMSGSSSRSVPAKPPSASKGISGAKRR